MPRELITVQVGQCGNQIGCRFWDLARQEHKQYNKLGVFDEAISSFFRNTDARDEEIDIPVGNGKTKIQKLKARAVLIDMEEGVVNEIMRDKNLADLFEPSQMVTSISGSGNNWAHGYAEYGPKYQDAIIESCRRAVEYCDSLQSFLLLHSLGGGTGSGLGSFILESLEDNFPEVYRFTTSVFPSEDDDVVTSPYNSMLALNKLCEHADCVLPVDNQSLIDIVNKLTVNTKGKSLPDPSVVKSKKNSKPFDSMNNIAAHLLLNLTSSMRFGGTLNVDLNEITMNLVPYPKMHFLLSSLNPIYSLGQSNVQPRTLDQMFTDAFHPDYQLLTADPKRHTYLACALMVRGADIEMSDIRRNIERMRPNLQFIHWNQEGWKVGHCLTPSVGQKHSLLCLSNNCAIKDTFQTISTRFNKLYSRKAHLYHYTDFITEDLFEESLETTKFLIDEYSRFEKNETPPPIKRMIPI